MPICPADLFRAAELQYAGTIRWGLRFVPLTPGAYVIATTPDPNCNAPLFAEPPFAKPSIENWLARVPGIRLRRSAKPSADEIADALKPLWLPTESVLYIGMATSLRKRLNQFFDHELGARHPHKGGHWLKTLRNMHDLHVHFCTCETPDDAAKAESRLLDCFVAHFPPSFGGGVFPLIPFANRRYAGCAQRSPITHDVC